MRQIDLDIDRISSVADDFDDDALIDIIRSDAYDNDDDAFECWLASVPTGSFEHILNDVLSDESVFFELNRTA